MKYSMYIIPLRTKKGGGENELCGQTFSTSLLGHQRMPRTTWSLVPTVNWRKETNIREGSMKLHGISLERDAVCNEPLKYTKYLLSVVIGGFTIQGI